MMRVWNLLFFGESNVVNPYWEQGYQPYFFHLVPASMQLSLLYTFALFSTLIPKLHCLDTPKALVEHHVAANAQGPHIHRKGITLAWKRSKQVTSNHGSMVPIEATI